MALYIGRDKVCIAKGGSSGAGNLVKYVLEGEYTSGIATFALPTAYGTLDSFTNNFVCGMVSLIPSSGHSCYITLNPKERSTDTPTSFYIISFNSSGVFTWNFAGGQISDTGNLVLSIDPYSMGSSYSSVVLTLVMEAV